MINVYIFQAVGKIIIRQPVWQPGRTSAYLRVAFSCCHQIPLVSGTSRLLKERGLELMSIFMTSICPVTMSTLGSSTALRNQVKCLQNIVWIAPEIVMHISTRVAVAYGLSRWKEWAILTVVFVSTTRRLTLKVRGTMPTEGILLL